MLKEIIKNIIRVAMVSETLSLPRKTLGRMVAYALQIKGFVLVPYNDSEREKVIELIRSIKKETEMLLADNEAYQLFATVKAVEKIQGDIAEIGVYKGGSARLICEAKGKKCLHLFDTFEGIPKVETIDAPMFHKGQYSSSLEDVKNYLKCYDNVLYYRGTFPDNVQPREDLKFSFVHLDVDTYRSTLKCLEYFYFRLSPGAVIISHDYISAAGVRKAIDEFFQNRIEPIIELSGSQCLIMKLAQ